MASPNTSFDTVATETLKGYSKTLADNVLDNNPAFFLMKKKGGVSEVDGGTNLQEALAYAENGTFNWISGYEEYSTSPSEILTNAEFSIKEGTVSIIGNRLETIQNSGIYKIRSLLKDKISIAEKTAQNQMSAAWYSDGTGSGGKQPGGLQHLVSITPTTGTVGSINAATWTFWRNHAISLANGTLTSSNIAGYFSRMRIATTRNNEQPNIGIAGDTIFRLYEEHLQGRQYIVNKELADAGFGNVGFSGIPIVLGGGVGGALATKTCYFLNTDYVKIKYFKGANWTQDEKRTSINQHAFVIPLYWAGNFTMSNRQMHSVLYEALS